ncbi:SMP-30/gluconolactonase/LRE family protein [Sphingomonas alpina]|uniref:SMP-30/gluconolactonase/LRE family protein n=1 Tax=Sphingomonas alpina TaxID=653931 RepID=UPI0021BB88E6|nr:SMP-30/gluconolactonase/LRE family protein [Sphingomonas alpina]
MTRVDCVADVRAILGEGPLWDASRHLIWWVDIKGRALHRHDVISGANDVQPLGFRLTALGLDAQGGLVGCGDPGFVRLAVDEPTLHVSIATVIGRIDEPAGNRFNDGKVDPAGRFWAGTMDDAEESASGVLYRLDPSAAPVAVRNGIMVPNGPAFASPDTMYRTDSAAQRVTRVMLDEAGNMVDEQLFAQFAPDQGYPDGMTVDADGHLWIAFWDGWCVRRLSPAGAIVAEIRLPVQRPTCPVFGGPALDRMFVTSATVGLDAAALAAQPMAGGLLSLDPGVRGVAPAIFGGR